MPPLDVALVLARRWFILAILLALVVVASFFGTKGPLIYWTKYDIELVPPSRQVNVYAPQADPTYLVRIAHVLEEVLTSGESELRAATQSAPILRLGYPNGTLVAAKNKGTQWTDDFAGALAVQVTGSTLEEVRKRDRDVRERVDDALRSVQDELRVAPNLRVTAYEPRYIEISVVAPQRTRAVVMALLLGGVLSLVATLMIDRSLERRALRRRRSGQSASPEDSETPQAAL